MKKLLTLFLLALTASVNAAISKDDFDFDVDKFLADIDTPTYVCLSSEKVKKLTQLENAVFLTEKQNKELFVELTQHDICSGRILDAEAKLLNFVKRQNVDKNERYYADAIYQLGFLYDTQSNSKGCQFYNQAIELAHKKFEDISVTARIYKIESCSSKTLSKSDRLRYMFDLIKEYTGSDNYEMLSFIHNALGLLYNRFDQEKLAAEQYKIAFQLMKDSGEPIKSTTKIDSYINALLNLRALDEASKALVELKKLAATIDTPDAKITFFHLQSQYYLYSKNYTQLGETLEQWSKIEETRQDVSYKNLYEYFVAELCLFESNNECIKNYIDSFYKQSAPVIKYFSLNRDFLSFMVRSYIQLGDLESAKVAFDTYNGHLNRIRSLRDNNTAWFTLSDLFAEVNALEKEMARERRLRENFSTFIIVGLLLVFIVVGGIALRVYKSKMRYDQVTGLLTTDSALQEIMKLEKPVNGRVHAMAIFDLENFRDVNRQLGPVQGDRILQTVANTLKTISRQNDVVGRFAPEQFILCLTNIEESTATSFLERVKKALEASLVEDQFGVDVSLKSSLSIYISDSKLDDLQSIIDDMLMSLNIEGRRP